jgi:hypothetical protein
MLTLRSLTAPSLLPRLSLTARVTSSVVSPPLSPSRFSTARSVLSPYLSHNRELQLMTGEPLISSRRSLSSVASSSTLPDPSSAPRSAYPPLHRPSCDFERTREASCGGAEVESQSRRRSSGARTAAGRSALVGGGRSDMAVGANARYAGSLGDVRYDTAVRRGGTGTYISSHLSRSMR